MSRAPRALLATSFLNTLWARFFQNPLSVHCGSPDFVLRPLYLLSHGLASVLIAHHGSSPPGPTPEAPPLRSSYLFILSAIMLLVRIGDVMLGAEKKRKGSKKE